MKSGRLLADRILQHIGSERSDPIREMHFLDVELFGWTSFFKTEEGTWIRHAQVDKVDVASKHFSTPTEPS